MCGGESVRALSPKTAEKLLLLTIKRIRKKKIHHVYTTNGNNHQLYVCHICPFKTWNFPLVLWSLDERKLNFMYSMHPLAF